MPAAIAESPAPESRIDEPRPLTPVSVLVYAKDPISRAGVASQLVGESGIEVVEPTPGRIAHVAVVVAETVDDEVIKVVRTIRRGSRTQVVLVAMSLDSASTLAAIDAGTAAFLLRPMANRERLVHVVMGAHHGRESLTPTTRGGRPTVDADRGHSAIPGLPGLPELPPRPPVARLTARELDVLRLLAEGSDTAEIAVRLAYSEPTIKNVIQRLFERLQVRNRPHAVAVAVRAGII
jgi:DNA-binding NarL/FixJ family response regulator